MTSTSTSDTTLHELLDDAPCGFMVFTDEGVITKINRSLCALLHYAPENVLGKKVEYLLNIAGRIFYQTHFFPLITLHGKAEEIFLTLIGKDNIEVPVLVNAKRRVQDGAGENHCVLMPVYHRKKFEQELLNARKTAEEALSRNELLQQATRELEEHKIELDKQVTKLSLINKDLSQFSNIISHDMQEPIRKIAMFADIIQREDHEVLGKESLSAIEKIKLFSQRARELTSSLQQFVAIDSVVAKPDLCNLNEIVTGSRLKATADKPRVELIVNSAPLPEVEGHCQQFELLFYHLIVNAIQFRKWESKAEINIDADIIQQNSFQTIKGKYRYMDFARIVVSDKGQGFSNEYSDYVFQLFKKAHPEAPGLGIGLSLCKKIVENHYGSISARSQPGEGTSFTILLPLKSALPMAS